MSTKQDPGPFDCYAKLAPDEPYFVLRAKDPTAPDFVVLWAAVRELRYGDYPKLGEARKCAQEMRRWRAAYIAITWVPFTDDSQVQPGRRMRMGERDPEILTIARLRLLGGRANILFSDGAGLDLENAKRKPWEIEA